MQFAAIYAHFLLKGAVQLHEPPAFQYMIAPHPLHAISGGLVHGAENPFEQSANCRGKAALFWGQANIKDDQKAEVGVNTWHVRVGEYLACASRHARSKRRESSIARGAAEVSELLT